MPFDPCRNAIGLLFLVISRYFVIALAAGLSAYQATRRQWPEAIGLAALAIGLTCLRVADLKQQPLLRRVAWGCFAITLVAMGMIFQSKFLH